MPQAADHQINSGAPGGRPGRYVRKVALTTTMGPSIPVDPAKTRGLIDDIEDAATAAAAAN